MHFFSRLKEKLKAICIKKAEESRPDMREVLIGRYIHGDGIEIGALHQPVDLKNRATVRYVDRMSCNDLRAHYPELSSLNLTEVDVIDDGEKLLKFENSSVDFIIANHFIEHAQDPIRTIKRHVEVLKPSGILYMAVPDKRFTFDIDRPLTAHSHLIHDHDHGPQASYIAHVEEYVRLVDKLDGAEFTKKVEQICQTDYSIHFHVWDPKHFEAFLRELVINRYKTKVEVVEIIENPCRQELICVLKKI